jgi:hypothetical protein
MLKVNATQWLRYRTQFKIPRSVEVVAASKVFRSNIITPKSIGRSIGTQTETMSTKFEPHTPAASVTAAFHDLLGVSVPNSVPDDLKNTFYQRELPSSLVRFASPEGKKMFREAMDSGHAEGFFPLTGNFTTQSEPAYCGPSSCKLY